MAFRCLLHLTWAWLPRRTLIETSRPISKVPALAAMHRWLKLLVVSGTLTNIVDIEVAIYLCVWIVWSFTFDEHQLIC